MKVFLKIIIFLIAISCKTGNSQKNKEKGMKDDSLYVSVTSKPKKEIKKVSYKMFVSARSGLNFRNKPQGAILGKFNLNKRVEVVEMTSVSEEITDEGRKIKGQWVGVKKDDKVVYVFNGFLSENYTSLDICLYDSSSDEKNTFVNVSEKTPFYYNDSITLFKKGELGKKMVLLDKARRKRFLKVMGFSERDTIYCYQVYGDVLKKEVVRNTDVVANINAYAFGSEKINNYDYEYGFKLKKHMKYSFVYIGKSNPFQTGTAKPILWEKIKNIDDFSQKYKFEKFNLSSELREVLKYSYKDYKLYMMIYVDKKYGLYRHLVAMNVKTNKVVLSQIQKETEGINLVSLTMKGEKRKENSFWYREQIIGSIFKNKVPIIYGFMGYSFGCEHLDFLDVREPRINILCDNRH